MINRLPTHCGDNTCAAAVIAGDFIFIAHQAGGHDRDDVVHQMRASFDSLRRTLEQAGTTLDDMVQINLYLRDIKDFDAARNVFSEYFKNGAPARMTTTTDFIDASCLCMLDGVAYKKR